jgi:phosphoribosylformylglycinamidine synthase
MSADCNTRFCYIDPKLGSASAVMESGRNVAVTGATPKAITDCLNFGNPENPEVMWQFKEACEGIKEACKALNTPVVSGNVSLYNETNGVGVFPTPSIAMVGVCEDANKTVGSTLTKSDNSLYLLGNTFEEFGGSLYLKKFSNEIAGTMPKVDFKAELRLWNVLIDGADKHIIKSAKDVGVGGIAIALAKMSAYSEFGLDVQTNLDKNLFSESLSRAIVEVADEASFERLCHTHAVDFIKIGQTTSNQEIKIDDIKVSKEWLTDRYFNRFKEVIERDL